MYFVFILRHLKILIVYSCESFYYLYNIILIFIHLELFWNFEHIYLSKEEKDLQIFLCKEKIIFVRCISYCIFLEDNLVYPSDMNQLLLHKSSDTSRFPKKCQR